MKYNGEIPSQPPCKMAQDHELRVNRTYYNGPKFDNEKGV